MRILNIIASVDPAHGGPIEGAMQLARIWGGNRHEVTFVTLDASDAPYVVSHEQEVIALGHLGAPRRRTGPLRFRERFAYSPRLVPWLRARRGDYDAIIVHGLWNYSTLAARRVLVGQSTPYFVFPHGSLDPWFKRNYPMKSLAKVLIWPVSEGRLMNDASAVLFTTEEEKQLAKNVYRPYRVTGEVVGFGGVEPPSGEAAQIAAFRRAVPALGDRAFLLFLSRIHPKKGCDLLIDAFARIAAAHPSLDLVMAGPDQTGWRGMLEEAIGKRGLAARVHWTGMIEGDVKWGAYRACEAFALTSHSENFGIVVAEALACAKPVLITDKVNLWREVAADHAGLVESDTQQGAVQLLARFLALDAPARHAMGERARGCFERHFRMAAAADNVLAAMRRNGVAA